jgi:hypothetical protein
VSIENCIVLQRNPVYMAVCPVRASKGYDNNNNNNYYYYLIELQMGFYPVAVVLQ